MDAKHPRAEHARVRRRERCVVFIFWLVEKEGEDVAERVKIRL